MSAICIQQDIDDNSISARCGYGYQDGGQKMKSFLAVESNDPQFLQMVFAVVEAMVQANRGRSKFKGTIIGDDMRAIKEVEYTRPTNGK